MLRTKVMQLQERIGALSELTDAKFVTLRTVVDGQADKVKLALDAADKAVTKAEISVNDRLSAMNEFRGALSDQAQSNVSRLEFDQFRRQYTEAHTLLRDGFTAQVAEMRDSFGKQLAELKERQDRNEGRRLGSAGTIAAVGTGITLIVIVVNVVLYALST